MHITYRNLSIRNATPADAELLCNWWNDGKVMAHAGFPDGLNTTPEAVASRLLSDSDDTGRRLIIETDGLPAGEMSYRNLGGGKAEIGIKICDWSRQNRGYGSLLLQMLIGSLFHDFGYTAVVCDTNLNNERAQHVYEKLGFRKLRGNRDAGRDQRGEWQSFVDYELSPADFQWLPG